MDKDEHRLYVVEERHTGYTTQFIGFPLEYLHSAVTLAKDHAETIHYAENAVVNVYGLTPDVEIVLVHQIIIGQGHLL